MGFLHICFRKHLDTTAHQTIKTSVLVVIQAYCLIPLNGKNNYEIGHKTDYFFIIRQKYIHIVSSDNIGS